MSYEGYVQYICEDGHYTVTDAYEVFYDNCNCGKCMKWHCSVDVTNGYEESCPETKPGLMEKIGWNDRWHFDHYGTKYVVKVPLYKPVNKDNENKWYQVDNI